MRYLLFVLLFGLFSCDEVPGTDVYIENEQNSSEIIISGKIDNGAGIKIYLEAPLLESKGTKVEVAKSVIGENGSFEIKTTVPGLGYYLLKLKSETNDSLELSLNKGEHLELNTSLEDFVNNPIKKEMKLSSIMSDIYEENKSFIEEAEETISTIQQVKNKSFDDVLKENNGVPFDPKELSALQSKQINFGGTGKVKFILNKSKNEIKTEVFSNGTTKQCVIKKLVDNDTKNMYNYALFVQTIDENKKSSKIFYLLSGLFDNNDSDKIKTLTDFIDRFNSYGL